MNPSPTILAIAPGTKEFGIAVFNGYDLNYFSVKTISSRTNPPEQVSEILKILFVRFTPQIVVIKSINKYQRLSNNLENIVKQIKLETKQKNLKVSEITLEKIKTELCNGRKSTKSKAVESLFKEYPELKRFWNRPNKWQNDYYSWLFSAVAVGVVFLKTRSKM